MAADRNLGVLAFGDSITNGGGELQWGIALQSWALWTARALGLAFTSYAADGARVGEVARDQLESARERTANSDARYDLGCLHIGVNDVRALDWDADAFAADLRTVVDFLAERCERIVVLSIPVDLGRPRPDPARIASANATITAEAARAGATLVDLRGFRGRGILMADHVHPTALGQVAIANRVVDILAGAPEELPSFPATYGGKARKHVQVFARPSDLLGGWGGDDPRTNLPAVREGGGHPRPLDRVRTTWTERLRADLTYTYRHAKVSARELRLRLLSR
jgi:lysophospholipase L1-like esterase